MINFYQLDKKDRIISVNNTWDEFAHDNGGTHVFEKDICGCSLWDFIAGDSTRMWMQSVLWVARLKKTVIERPYRCDSPELKRFMKMRIIPDRGGVLRIEHEVMSTEQIAVPVYAKYGVGIKHPRLKLKCSFCSRIKYDRGWEEFSGEDAGESSEIYVAYGVCEDCQRLMAVR